MTTTTSTVTRWPLRPSQAIASDRNGVIAYAPSWDALICVPCQREAGPAGRRELGFIRPATSDDLRRLGCCTSCGRELPCA